MNACFHPLPLCDIKELVHGDKYKVAPILQSGAIIPLQKKKVQQDDVIKRMPVKSQMEKI